MNVFDSYELWPWIMIWGIKRRARREVYGPGDEIEVEMFPGLVISLKDVFELPDNKELPSPGKQAVKNEL